MDEWHGDPNNPVADLKTLLSWPSIASKHWVYRQYDHMVRASTAVFPGSDAAVVRSYRGQIVEYPQPAERDCTVPYDDVFFAGEPEDDDREGGIA